MALLGKIVQRPDNGMFELIANSNPDEVVASSFDAAGLKVEAEQRYGIIVPERCMPAAAEQASQYPEQAFGEGGESNGEFIG